MYLLKQKTFLIIVAALLTGTISYAYSVNRARADNFYSLQNTPHACSTQAECDALNAGGPDSTGKLNAPNTTAASSPSQSSSNSDSGGASQNCWHSTKEMIDTPSNMSNFNWQMCPDATNDTNQTSGTGDVNAPPTTVTSPADNTDQTQPADSGNTDATIIPSDQWDNSGTDQSASSVFDDKYSNTDATIIPSDQWDNSGTDQSASSVFDDKYSPMAVPLISQPTAITCGPTSLAMDASYWGINLPVSEIISDTNMTNTGTRLSDLETTAKNIGLTVVSDNLSITSNIEDFVTGSDALSDMTTAVNDGYPAIVNLDLSPYSGGHAVVVTGITDDSVYVNNPAGNGSQQVYSKSDFTAMWSAKGSEYIVLGPPKK